MEVSSIISMIIAGGALALSLISTLKKSAKEDSAQIAKMMTLLDGLANDMREIKDDFRRDIAELKVSHQSDHDKIIILERDLKTCWNRYDELSSRIRGVEK